jgi:hypothetical protein
LQDKLLEKQSMEHGLLEYRQEAAYRLTLVFKSRRDVMCITVGVAKRNTALSVDKAQQQENFFTLQIYELFFKYNINF